MLLFVKKPFVHWLRDGLKRIEIRAGSRYQHLREGHILSMNGHFRMRITHIDRFESIAEMTDHLPKYLSDPHYQTVNEATHSIRSCYPSDIVPILFLHVSHVIPQTPAPQQNLLDL